MASKNGHKPEGLRTITPYFHTEGASGFINFLEQVFGAKTRERHDSPEGLVLHAKMVIGDSVLELSDARGQAQPMASAIHLYVSDADATYRRALQAGATSLYEPTDRLGRRTAAFKDAYGHSWYLDTAEVRAD